MCAFRLAGAGGVRHKPDRARLFLNPKFYNRKFYILSFYNPRFCHPRFYHARFYHPRASPCIHQTMENVSGDRLGAGASLRAGIRVMSVA